MFCSKKFCSHIVLFTHLNIQLLYIIPNIKKCFIERNSKIYIWNELHSIVVVKYELSSISARKPTGG